MASRSVRRAVIPAAGMGTRFFPITKAVPKMMLPLVDRPTIQYAVEECVASGIEQVGIVIGPGQQSVRDHFTRPDALERELEERGKTELLEILRSVDRLAEAVEIQWFEQERPLGLGHAVWCARDLIGDEAFAVLLPDDVTLSDPPWTGQLIAVHEATHGCVLTGRHVGVEQVSRYGIMGLGEQLAAPGAPQRVTALVEKPPAAEAPSDFAVMGRYVLTADVLETLAAGRRGAGGEVQLTDAIAIALETTGVSALEFAGDFHDTGELPGYLTATLAMALADPRFRDGLQPVLRRLLQPD